MLSLLFLFTSLAFAQSTPTIRTPNLEPRLNNLDLAVRELQLGNPTITGAPTFKSSFTIQSGGKDIILSTSSTSGVRSIEVNGSDGVVTIADGLASGLWNVILSTNPSGASTSSLTLPATGNQYRVSFFLAWETTAGRPLIRFNADTGNNYRNNRWGYRQSASGVSGSQADSSIITLNSTDVIAVGDSIYGSFLLRTHPADTTIARVVGQANGEDNASGEDVGAQFNGFYDGASDITSVSLTASAGTFSGNIVLERQDP